MPRAQPKVQPAMAPTALARRQRRRKAMGMTAEPMKTPMARYIQPRETPALLRRMARTPMKQPKARMMAREILRICSPVALGLMYVR